MARRKLLAGTFLLIALLAIAVASAASAGPARTPKTPKAPTLAAEYRPGPCPTLPPGFTIPKDAVCGQLVVPEDRAERSQKTISLSVARIPAKHPAKKQPDPVVWLAGGPGDDALTEIEMAVKGHLDEDREVIFMSQRGTYSATPRLTCPDLDRWPEKTLNMPYGSPETGRIYLDLTRRCRDELFHREGVVDLGAYNTLESADDLDELRRALGIKEWNVYGISYGTDLALNYLRMHRDGIRSVAIDGIFPPSLAGGVSSWISAGEGIRAIFAACAASKLCKDRYGDIEKTWVKLVNQYEKHPLSVKVDVPELDRKDVPVMINGAMLLQWTISPGSHWAAKVPAYFDDLDHGDWKPIARSWARSRLDPGAVGALGDGLFEGIACGEWVHYEEQEQVTLAARDAFPSLDPSIWANAPNLPFMRQNCAAWGVPPVPDEVREVTRSKDIPVLVIDAQYDSQTATSFGQLVAQTLRPSNVVTIPNVAHVAFASPSKEANECTHELVGKFLEKLRLGPSDFGCIAKVKPTDFEINRRPDR